MEKKIKFKPVITRVKLNPEQAVLTCLCHDQATPANKAGGSYTCDLGGGTKQTVPITCTAYPQSATIS